MRKFTATALACGTLLALALVSPRADATIVRAFSLSAMTTTAQSIVRGTVVATEVVYDARWGRVYTHSVIEVHESLWGVERPGDVMVLRQIGGELDGILSMVVGTAAVGLGDEVVAFTRTGDGLHYLVGMAQGLYTVDRSDVTRPVVHRGEGVHGLKLELPAGPARAPAASRMTLRDLVGAVRSTLRVEGRLP